MLGQKEYRHPVCVGYSDIDGDPIKEIYSPLATVGQGLLAPLIGNCLNQHRLYNDSIVDDQDTGGPEIILRPFQEILVWFRAP